MYEMYITQDAFLEYFKFCLKGNIPDVETNAKRTIGLYIQTRCF